ncbi:MAG: NYN domain-containing protein [Gemmatimonadales bacterium]
MSHPAQRAGRPPSQAANPPTPALLPVHHAPHAALLIDFDNVTLGIRSDLTKELRTLLNSDIIKGKVAVQRAYADWRRYPQYIVPLSESSIDLIFAPAFGTNKKNATDIRLAVDATELVFTRPEIGTFILLSGDSDFSSLVIKLKEYGKYVIGVGIRESASDLLIQNCDEYYSYSDLAGLTREEEPPSTQRDPWELVGEAVEQMVRNRDVMRSDRLKQVMQQIDPNFDERNAGFNRFSKFVTEAGTRGLITVTKLENGQFEVGQAAGRAAEPPSRRAAEAPEAAPENGRRRRGRGRGGARRGAEPREPSAERRAPSPQPPSRRAPSAEPPSRRAPSAEPPSRRAPSTERRAVQPSSRRAAEKDGRLTLAGAFQLLTRALAELPSPSLGDTVRARMAALHGREDPLLEPVRFPSLLRQAYDAEIADVRKTGENEYEVGRAQGRPLGEFVLAPPAAPPAPEVELGAEAATAEARLAPAALRFRRGSRSLVRPPQIPLVGVVQFAQEGQPGRAEPPESKPRRRSRAGTSRKRSTAPTKKE